MNQPLFLHIVERLEGFLHKLPEKLQKPILHELTPLKELFLKQRPPRFVLTGSHKIPVQEVFASLFSAAHPANVGNMLMEVFRWQTIDVGGFGSVSLLDARGADEAALRHIEEELRAQPADMFFHLVDGKSGRPVLSRETEMLAALLNLESPEATRAKVIGISLAEQTRPSAEPAKNRDAETKLQTALQTHAGIRDRLLQVIELPLVSLGNEAATVAPMAARFMAGLARDLPNESRIEMARISRDREAQTQIAQTLIKSTSAICTAIGAQPIPLADLPVLTTLQLVMVSGIMYISGRDRSLRAATEFAAALGVNVGAGMILREGARVVLKFFPGWGNVVCGMVAGAGTYALGRAAVAYFLEGVTLKDARRTYLRSRKDSPKARALRGRRVRTTDEAAAK